MLEADSRVFVAGHRGLVGSAIVRRLEAAGYRHLITRDRVQLDLAEAAAVDAFFAEQRPEFVFMAAARVGGIHANNTCPVEFLRDNLLLQTHVISAAHRHGVRKLLFLGSSCIYPRDAPQPMTEESLLTGPLEPTNQWYAIAKIAGIKLCQAYRRQYGFDAISVMPTNLYGPGDNFHPEDSHVLPALIRRFHEARQAGLDEVVVWGTGTPRREFLYVDDLADACLFLMQHYSDEAPINVGVGQDIAIAGLAALVAGVTGFGGRVRYDTTRPDGTARKLLDVSRINALGWRARTGLREGLTSTCRWFVDHQDQVRGTGR